MIRFEYFQNVLVQFLEWPSPFLKHLLVYFLFISF